MMPFMTTHTFTVGEERANYITHGVGALISLAALVILIVFASLQGTAWHIISFTLFGATMLLLYTASTLVHSFPPGRAKDFFEFLDHSAIYFFIAGTYTPFLFIVIQGWLGWTLFGTVWGLAIAGTVFKAFFVKKFLFISTIVYVVMGWLIVLAWDPLLQNLHPNGLTLLIIGGLLYTVGAVFYVWRAFKYHHAVWHVFVIGGTITHFFCVLFYVLPL
ncbi:PAQR family membrane homeostasis protein TrhA [Guptibacillus algicola]|uniref:PAQR family membrane homeostasis protein TrhA n=1 Tax=Guptibacillus algicola TaxID=225844 RepID=UPI001CD54AAB|nr:hemolysin III family protein [Alkalihalobacillus algicola]MCA0986708.1 hemolysin III family protein [Alkalihalobacillus algicola]